MNFPKHRLSSSASSLLHRRSPDDVVCITGVRTPITRALKGGLKDSHPEELLGAVLRNILVRNPKLPREAIEEVCIGTVLQELGGAKAGRMSMLYSGYHVPTAFSTVNRQCASGLQAITNIAMGIRTGMFDVGIGGGMESMSRNYFDNKAIPKVLWEDLKQSRDVDVAGCILPMGITSENVAERYGINRAEQDQFAIESHLKAATAQRKGLFKEEIVEVSTKWIDLENPKVVKQVVVTEDDGIRPHVTLEAMAKLKPAFKPDGSSTAGNSSQVSDGAAGVLMMRRSFAENYGLKPIARFIATRVVGVKPDEMGIGPAVAVPKLLEATSIEKRDVDIWEINEAFASQALYCVRELGLDMKKVNPKGGAIALGHPLGATGARQLATMLPELKRTGGRIGVVSLCIGAGQGMASMVVSE